MIAAAVLYPLLRRQGSSRTPVVGVVEDQTFIEAIAGQPQWVNPLLAVSQADRDLASLVFSGLTRLNRFGEPVPDLAQSWQVSADGLVYIFHLRQDVVWHDGTPFTAADVDFTMSLLRDPAYPGPSDLAGFWRTVETYAEDDYTVRFVLTQPLASFPEYTRIGLLPAHRLIGISPAALPDDPFNLAPVGTGRLVWAGIEQQRNLSIVRLTPNASFYDASRRVQLENVQFYFYPDADAAFRALGEAQAFGGLSAGQLDAVFETPQINVYTARYPIYSAIVFNQQAAARLPFFQDVAVRRALTLALDRPRIVGEVLGRQALPAYTPMLPGTWAYNPLLEPLGYDPNLAGQELDLAGWTLSGNTRAKEGVPLTFTLLVGDTPVDRQIGQQVVEAWQAIGVDATLDTLDPADLLDRIQAPPGEQGRDFDAVLIEFSQGLLADPDPYPFWHESQYESGQNFGGVVDFDLSQALEIARKDPNGVRRAELYREFQALFSERAIAILLYNPVYHYAVSCQVGGVQLMILADASDRFASLHEWRILSQADMQAACGQ